MPIIDLSTAEWLNEPAEWSIEDDVLSLTTKAKTDYWQATYYGFHRDDGHFLHVPVSGDFTATVIFDGDYEELYDQAGLMLRVDAKHWVKLGIEHSDGTTNFSFVKTDGNSDWSVISRPRLSGPQAVRVTRVADALLAHYITEDGAWQLMRLCPFTASDAVVGPMACSPERAGFRARFLEFRIDPAVANPLHG